MTPSAWPGTNSHETEMGLQSDSSFTNFRIPASTYALEVYTTSF